MFISKFKKFSQLFLSIFLVSGILISGIPKSIAVGDDVITIYHTNDLHGKVGSVYGSDGTLSQIGLDVLKTVKDSTKNSMLVDIGDATQGVSMATYSKGSNIINLMNAAGYDAMVLGNHEFDYGEKQAKINAQSANFPVLAANIVYKETGEPFLKDVNGTNGCNFIKEINGKKIGFFGICTKETKYKSDPNNTANINILDEITVSKEQVSYLKSQNVDAIVALAHIGVAESSEITSKDIAENVPGIDVIIDGHSHSTNTLNVNNTIIQQVGTNATALGKIELYFNNNKLEVKADIMSPAQIGEKYKADPQVSQIYDDIYQNQKLISEKVIGKTKTALFGGTYEGKSVCRLHQTNLGYLVADSMLWSAKNLIKDKEAYNNLNMVVFQNAGGVRASIESGYITIEDVNNVLSTGNLLSLKEITPKLLYEAMEHGFSELIPPYASGEPITGASGALPVVAGMRIEADLSKNPETENRIQKIIVLNDDQTDKLELDRNDDQTKIVLVSNSFEMIGGDGYSMLVPLPYIAQGDILYNILAEYINKLVTENDGILDYPIDQNRVTYAKQKQLFPEFNCTVAVKEESSDLINKKVKVKVDSNEQKEMETDSTGLININNLDSGAHLVNIEYNGNSTDVLIDNMSGVQHATAVIKDKTLSHIKSVTNIINQLPSDVKEENAAGLIKFARTSYNSLDKESQDQVLNYKKLKRAEKALEDLNNPAAIIGNDIVVAVVIFCIGVIAICLIIILNDRKKHRV